MLHKAVLPGLYVLGPAQPGAAGEHGSMSVVPAPAPAAAAAAAAAAALAAAAAAAVAAPPASPTRRRDLPKTEPPPGAVFDDTVTTFKGYYMESVANSALEVRGAGAWACARGVLARACATAAPPRCCPLLPARQTWRVRKLIIRFYLRDSKVEVDEEQVRVCARARARSRRA